MRHDLSLRGNRTLIAHFGNVANVPYLLAAGMKKFYNTESLVFLPLNVNLRTKKALYGYESGNPYDIHLVYLNGILRSFVDILRSLVQEKVNIIHMHGGVSVISSIITSIIQPKIVLHFHGSDLRRDLSIDKWKRIYFHCKFLNEDKILVSTPDLFQFLVWKDALRKAEYLPNPVDPMIYEPKTECQEECTIFLPTLHDEDTKKTSVAFEAWKILRKLNSKVVLKTIMSGRDFPTFYEKFKDDNRILWLPVLTRKDFVKHLRSSSIVWGQFALGIVSLIELEAMAAGKPVITYYKPSLYDHVNYKKPIPLDSYRSPTSIAHATNNLLADDGKRRTVGHALRQWVLHHHSLERVSERLYDIYKHIL